MNGAVACELQSGEYPWSSATGAAEYVPRRGTEPSCEEIVQLHLGGLLNIVCSVVIPLMNASGFLINFFFSVAAFLKASDLTPAPLSWVH